MSTIGFTVVDYLSCNVVVIICVMCHMMSAICVQHTIVVMTN